MKSFFLAVLVAACPLFVFSQTSGQKATPPAHPNAPATDQIQTETIASPGQTPAIPSAQTGAAARMEPTQIKALAHKIWLAQFRLNDLLAQVHSEKWTMPPAVRQSFDQSLDSLRKSLAAQEDWRSQFEARPESLYLGFQTYIAISAVLPRIDGVAQSVSRYENASFGVQYAQSANQLFDLQQQIVPHLTFLLKNQDDFLLIAQTNLASCQNELNYAERNKEGQATPMKNIAPEFKGHSASSRHATHAASTKSAPKAKTTAKPAANSPDQAQKK